MFACQDDAGGRLPLRANGPFRLRSGGFELGDVLCPAILRFRQSAGNSDCEIPTAYKDTRGRTLVGASRFAVGLLNAGALSQIQELGFASVAQVPSAEFPLEAVEPDCLRASVSCPSPRSRDEGLFQKGCLSRSRRDPFRTRRRRARACLQEPTVPCVPWRCRSARSCSIRGESE